MFDVTAFWLFVVAVIEIFVLLDHMHKNGELFWSCADETAIDNIYDEYDRKYSYETL